MQKEAEELLPEWCNERKSPLITIFKMEKSKDQGIDLLKLETRKQTA